MSLGVSELLGLNLSLGVCGVRDAGALYLLLGTDQKCFLMDMPDLFLSHFALFFMM